MRLERFRHAAGNNKPREARFGKPQFLPLKLRAKRVLLSRFSRAFAREA